MNVDLVEILIPGKSYKGMFRSCRKDEQREFARETVDFTVLKTHKEASVILLHNDDGEIPRKYNEWKERIQQYDFEDLIDDKPYDDFEKIDNVFANFYLTFVIPIYLTNNELFGINSSDSSKILKLTDLKLQ